MYLWRAIPPVVFGEENFADAANFAHDGPSACLFHKADEQQFRFIRAELKRHEKSALKSKIDTLLTDLKLEVHFISRVLE